VQPAAKSIFSENHPGYAGPYWGPVSSPSVDSLVESADAYLFAGGALSDYPTTEVFGPHRPQKKLLLANSNDVCLARRLGRRWVIVPARPGFIGSEG
jgi:TPP-dependent 2-oxoacid decarboxylase